MKDWVMAHIGKPELWTPTDDKILDLVIVTIPQVVGMILSFTILSALYLWGLKKYGFDRTIIVLLVNLIVVISQVSNAIKSMTYSHTLKGGVSKE